MLATDITAEIPALDIPVYLMHGKYDYTVAYPLTKSYFQELKAPMKGFYTFENSAHGPFFEEPERFRMILKQDVLGGNTQHADASGD